MFYLPRDSGEKITLCSSILCSLSGKFYIPCEHDRLDMKSGRRSCEIVSTRQKRPLLITKKCTDHP